MGFFLTVQAGDEVGHLMTQLPTRGGNAILVFLTALQVYCPSSDDEYLNKWFQDLQIYIEQPLCEVFKPIMNCMWADEGEIAGNFLEDEYQWYCKRNPASSMTEAEFRQFIIEGTKHWSSIDGVIGNVKLLIDLFKSAQLSDKDGIYKAEYMIPDFELLHETLKIIENAWYKPTIRLNFT